MTSLSALFDGLIGFVPNKPSAAAGEVDEWHAVFADLRSAVGPEAGLPAVVPPHVAGVVVADDAVIDIWSDKTPSLIFTSRRFDDRLYRLYLLSEERLTVRYDGKTPLDAHYEVPSGETPGSGEEANLGWIVPMGEMGLPDAGVFNQDLISGDYFPVPGSPGLIGTVKIDGGRLRPSELIRRGSETLVFEFKGGPNGPIVRSQAQADRVLWTDEIAGERVFLEFEREGEDPSSVVLQPLDEVVELLFCNRELETVTGVGRGFDQDAFADTDFAVNYMLSAGWPFANQDLPIPHPRGGGNLGGSRESCSGGTYGG